MRVAQRIWMAALFSLAWTVSPGFGAALLPGTVVSSGGSNVRAGAVSQPQPPCNIVECTIVEGLAIQLPFVSLAGDVVLRDITGGISDVTRFLPNIVDTGGGTGLGNLVFEYSIIDADAANGTDFGLPATLSVNAVFLTEAAAVNGVERTDYNGNGTVYHIYSDVPEPSSFVLAGLGLLALLAARKRHFALKAALLPALALCPCVKSQVVEFDDGTQAQVKLHRGLMQGPGVEALSPLSIAATGLPFFTVGVNSFGTFLPITFIGTDPAAGSATTVVPTVIVPLSFRFAAGSVDASSIVPATVASPIFQPFPFTSGGVDLGTVQYADAVQRAQFWNFVNPSGGSRDYHLMLSQPGLADTQTIDVPPTSGFLAQTRNGNTVALIDISLIDAVIGSLRRKFALGAGQLPIFLAYNVLAYQGSPGNCCIGGFHSSTSGPAAAASTWVYASYYEHGVSSEIFEDVVPLSHEVSEWVNDPFVGGLFGSVPGVNWIPPTRLPQGGCLPNFETGDPVEALAGGIFSVQSGDMLYHLQDEVFLYWFIHTAPSPAVNGWYSLQNTFTAPGSLCGPG